MSLTGKIVRLCIKAGEKDFLKNLKLNPVKTVCKKLPEVALLPSALAHYVQIKPFEKAFGQSSGLLLGMYGVATFAPCVSAALASMGHAASDEELSAKEVNMFGKGMLGGLIGGVAAGPVGGILGTMYGMTSEDKE